MGTYTLALHEAGRRHLDTAGGKGASLGALTSAGFPVPPGFVVTTAAYTDFIEAAGLSGSDPDEMRHHIPRKPVPEQVATPILEAYRELGAPAVAVRSSGTAEDLADASFAGQHDTFLNITGEQAVLAAVRDCWASLWTSRVSYRQRHSWDERGLALAVVVQAMVDAEWAGVMFTVDPVTGRRDRMVIEAVRGLGEALVSGEATGDRGVVDKRTLRQLTTGSLPGSVYGQLARLGSQVEGTFGAPQDIEWTYANGECALVQARPLTALPEEPAGARKALPGSRAGRRQEQHRKRLAFAADHVPHPPYPMDRSLSLRPAIRAALDALRSAGFTVPAPEDVLVEIDDGVVQMVPPRIRPTPRVLLQAPATFPKLAGWLRTRPEDWLARCHATVVTLADRIDTADLTGLSDRQLIDRVEELRHAQGQLVPSRFGSIVPRALFADHVLVALLRLATDPQRARQLHTDLLSAIPCVTRAANLELDRLAATIRRSPELSRVYWDEDPGDVADRLGGFAEGRALLDDIDAYLRRYGYRQMSVPLAGFPPLRETPEVFHGLLAGLARAEADGQEEEGEARLARARSELTGGRHARTRLLGSLALNLSRPVRAGMAVREDSHFYLFMVVGAVTRRVLLELGRRLVERGVLAEAADVFYLELLEVDSLPPERAGKIVARRKAAREAALDHYTVVPAELLPQESTADALRGTPASRGTAIGRVRIIRSEAEFAKLGSGEILVCPYTNPAWTPLFFLARTVVADAGGTASHAAIVAREYGIPAVMGTGNGTRLLTDGQWVRVDGANGTVMPVRAPART